MTRTQQCRLRDNTLLPLHRCKGRRVANLPRPHAGNAPRSPAASEKGSTQSVSGPSAGRGAARCIRFVPARLYYLDSIIDSRAATRRKRRHRQRRRARSAALPGAQHAGAVPISIASAGDALDTCPVDLLLASQSADVLGAGSDGHRRATSAVRRRRKVAASTNCHTSKLASPHRTWRGPRANLEIKGHSTR